MTKINQIQPTAFKDGKKYIADFLLNKKNLLTAEDKKLLQDAYINDVLGYLNPRNLFPEQTALKRFNDIAAVNNHALMGNKEFLEGVNETLAKGAAKDIYKK